MTSTPLPHGDEKTQHVRSMFDAIAPRYELVNTLMTFGLDKRWRQRAVSDLRLASDSVVLDVAAGTGDFSRELTRQTASPGRVRSQLQHASHRDRASANAFRPTSPRCRFAGRASTASRAVTRCVTSQTSRRASRRWRE